MAWLEPRVRRWWLLAVLVLLMFVGYVGDRLWARHVEYQLIHSGITLPAKVAGAENKISGQPIGPGESVHLEMLRPDKTVEDLIGTITQPTVVGNNIIIHLDPDDHTRWTDRTDPTPLLDSILLGLFALPFIPALIWIARWQMGGLMRTWQYGGSAVAVVFDRRHSPIAPMSYTLRCSLQNHRRKDLFTVYVPHVGYGLEKGDLIWVVLPAKKGHFLAALWMLGGTA